MAEQVRVKEKVGKKVDLKKVKVVVSGELSQEEVMELDGQGAELLFDPDDFRVLDDDGVNALRFVNARNYFMNFELFQAVKRNKARGKLPDVQVLRSLSGNALDTLSLDKKDPRWHYCYKRPDEVDSCVNSFGYSVVSEDKKVDPVVGNRKVNSDKPGVPELVLLKIPTERFNEHLMAVGEESARRATAAKDTFKEKAGQINPKVAKAGFLDD